MDRCTLPGNYVKLHVVGITSAMLDCLSGLGGFVGHYLSDFLPDPTIVCINCMEGVWPKETVTAWHGYLHTCTCKNPDHASVDDIESYSTKQGFKWRRKLSIP
jgi:hypothetical protein